MLLLVGTYILFLLESERNEEYVYWFHEDFL